MFFQEVGVLLLGGFPKIRLGVQFKPCPKPFTSRKPANWLVRFFLGLLDRLGLGSRLLNIPHGLPQLGLALSLCSGQDVPVQELPCCLVPANRVPALPAAVTALAEAPLASGSAFCHLSTLLTPPAR